MSRTEAGSGAAGPLIGRAIGRRSGDRIVGASALNQRTLDQAADAARSRVPVLVLGPDGAGKRHVARAIHAWSERAGRPLVTVNAAGGDGAPDERRLAEALERAQDGSVILTGIDSLAIGPRDALLDTMRTGALDARDGRVPLPARARVIATARTDMASLLSETTVQVVRVAALSERTEDIVPLAAHFLAEFAELEGIRPVGFTPEARRSLEAETWTGNVRELRERIRQAVRLAGDGAISVEALALSVDGEDVPSFKEAKRAFEARYVKGLLRRCRGNISRAARLARKDRKDFYDVIRRTGVNPQEFRNQ